MSQYHLFFDDIGVHHPCPFYRLKIHPRISVHLSVKATIMNYVLNHNLEALQKIGISTSRNPTNYSTVMLRVQNRHKRQKYGERDMHDRAKAIINE